MGSGKRYEITVVPKASFLADQSDPAKNEYVFSYTITITNTGDVAAQLVSRHWIITDAEHKVQEVKGTGRGRPAAAPASPAKASSIRAARRFPRRWARCAAPTRCAPTTGTTFDAPIPPFTLSVPRTLH